MRFSRSGRPTLSGISLLVWLSLAAAAPAQSPEAAPAPFPSTRATAPEAAPSAAAAPVASPQPQASPHASPHAAPQASDPSAEPDSIPGGDDGDEEEDVPVRVRRGVLDEPVAGSSPGANDLSLSSPAPGARPDPTAPRAAPLTLDEDQAKRLTPVPRVGAEKRPTENYIRDDAQVFPAAVTATLTRTIQSLEGKADIFIVTKVIEDMALFDQASQAAFKEIVDEVNHYRVVVVFIAYNADRDRGIVSTNLGYGVWHILTKKDCENLFGKDDAALTVDGIKNGVERLVSTIAEYHKGHPDSPSAPAFTGLENLSRNLPRLLILGGVVVGLIWFWRRGANCPKCGAPLKTRVSISMATRTGRMAKKTFKCFRCGFTRRQSLLPTGGYGDAPGRASESVEQHDEEAEEAAPPARE